jgi:RNA polymerase sigma-70 factor (ECF subfamily)
VAIDTCSDEMLVARLCERDTEAFTLLYDRHNRLAFGLAYRMLEDPSLAEDVVQEAFLSVWRQAASFQAEKSAARTWLLSIVHHRAIDRIRRVTSREVSETALGGAPERADESTDVEREVHLSVEAEQVHEALGSLPPDQQEAIRLAYFKGLSHSEIAEHLQVPIGTIKGRLRLGLHKMRAALGPGGLPGATHDA